MRKLSIIIVVIIFWYILLDTYTQISFTPEVSQLFHNGHILTMDDDSIEVDAIYVEDGIIKGLGDKDTLEEMSKEGTKMIDLQGHTLMPGFIDPHTHPIASAFLHGMID